MTEQKREKVPKVRVAFRITEETDRRLRYWALDRRMNLSEAVEQALVAMMGAA